MDRPRENYWSKVLDEEKEKPYFKDLEIRIMNEYKSHSVFPKQDQIFRALMLTPYENVKVVIIGQDPYYQPGQANGLSFSVERGQPIPKSLQNIYKELSSDLHVLKPTHGDLTSWAEQGVLLLNNVLTVRSGKPNSHRGYGWETFTDRIIYELNNHPYPLVFLLWGNEAKRKAGLVDRERHNVLTSPHPSPLSAHLGFFGNHHFSKANEFLVRTSRTPIDWKIEG